MSLNTTPRTWVAAEVVTAAEMNTEVRDAVTGIQAGWSSFSPTWTGTTTNPAIGNGTIVGAWSRVGKSIDWSIVITCGSTTTYGSGSYILTLPIAAHARYAANTGLNGGGGTAFLGAQAFPISVVRYTSNTTIYMGAPTGGTVTNLVPFTFANGAILSIGGRYETT